MTKSSKMMSVIAALFVVFAFTSCGPAATDNTTRREVEDNARLMAIYRTLEGTYSGTLYPESPKDIATPVELFIAVVNVSDGVDENRQVRFRPEIRAFFNWKGNGANESRVTMIGRAYLKGNRTEGITRNDIASLKLETLNGNGNNMLYFNLDVSGNYLTGQFTQSNNYNRSGYVEFRLQDATQPL